MLRLPRFGVESPASVAEAVALLAEHGTDAMLIAGGTDLVPNLKHRLFDPKLLVSLARIEALSRIDVEADGTLVVGAMVSLDRLAADDDVRVRAPALAQAAAVVSGPQLRRMGTLGGNVMLDTRCRYYNQTHFWRKSLGYCLKKDGTACYVVAGGRKCVAAASNDTAPALMTLSATLVFEGAEGRRSFAIDELWKSDGIWNKQVAPTELLTEVRVAPQHAGHRGGYTKLRQRGAIDFPLLGLAARMDVNAGRVVDADLVAVALAAKPLRVKVNALCGSRVGDERAIEAVAQRVARQCHPLPNIPGDAEYRKAMLPVLARRLLAALAG